MSASWKKFLCISPAHWQSLLSFNRGVRFLYFSLNYLLKVIKRLCVLYSTIRVQYASFHKQFPPARLSSPIEVHTSLNMILAPLNLWSKVFIMLQYYLWIDFVVAHNKRLPVYIGLLNVGSNHYSSSWIDLVSLNGIIHIFTSSSAGESPAVRFRGSPLK